MFETATETRLPLRIGTRTLAAFRRRLVRIGVPLEAALEGSAPILPPLPCNADGYSLSGVPQAMLPALWQTGLRPVIRQSYRRSYAPLAGGWADYVAGFSAKSRSTLKRKMRRFAEAGGGAVDCRVYASPDEIAVFHRLARGISARTYQEQRLEAGLPDGQAVRADMLDLAARDAVRGFLLFLNGAPISYLYLPAEGATLVYAHLGYDPEYAALAPGTMLQYAAMERLIDEQRFAFLDFTEGEGQHKRLFGRAEVPSMDVLLLRATPANRAIGLGLTGFDGAVALAKAASGRLGIERLVRRIAR